jgi:hypothetical protein
MTNVKTHTKDSATRKCGHAPTLPCAQGERATRDCNDQTDCHLEMKINGKDINFAGALHMDKRQMTLLSSADCSKEASVVMRRRCMYMSNEGDLVRWQGELKQPDVHYIFSSNFIAVDVLDKLAVGPGSVCNVAANLLLLWLTMLAIALTNAYLLCAKHQKMPSEKCSPADFKVDLECALPHRAQKLSGVSGEEVLVRTQLSNERVATGDAFLQRKWLPAVFRGHAPQRDETKNRA